MPKSTVLLPGTSRVDSVNATGLDYDHVLDTPGRYRLRISAAVPYGPPDHELAGLVVGSPMRKFKQDFIVTIKPRR